MFVHTWTLLLLFGISVALGPTEGPATISGAPNAVVVGELGKSVSIRCLAYGYPDPAINWFQGQNGPVVQNSSLYEVRGNVLRIRELRVGTTEGGSSVVGTLGKYTCQAYNGYGKEATWSVVVEARMPEPELAVNPPRVPCAPWLAGAAPACRYEIDVPVYQVHDLCTLRVDIGECSDFRRRWYYVTAIKRCLEFYYGGCGGNGNNFASERECESRCKEETRLTTTPAQEEPAVKEEPKKPVEGCAGSKFGCCFDNKTAATGPQEQGCPCDATEHGCCPDGKQPARGPDMEGCVISCNNTTYGCCPDGETPAHGPENEGCCLQKPFGCCPDNYKPAEGPHLEGCGCQYAHFGCCPDNATVARGPNNEGCGCQYTQFGCCPDRHTEATGPDYEGCGCHTYQFGCCPDGTTIAKGPRLQGCQCQQSTYGCCGDGQTAAAGPDQAGCDCSSSKYGCCPDGQTEATGDKFLGCTDVPENRQAVCGLPRERGPCHNYTTFWYYDTDYGACARFWYGGCEGNGNRFSSQEECNDVCIHPAPKDACNLPHITGSCNGYKLKWHYDSTLKHCKQFMYGGCLGNDNNFESKELCHKQCEPLWSEDKEVGDTCKLAIERGPCAGSFGRWGFNPETRRCEQFLWGGCGGNANRFSSEAACLMRCHAPGVMQHICELPMKMGPCDESLMRYFYDPADDSCKLFIYSGCDGNGNNFESLLECERRCRSSQPTPSTPTLATPATPVQVPEPPLPRECEISPSLEECAGAPGGEVWYYEPSARACVAHSNDDAGAAGPRCRATGTFPFEEACLRSCGAFRDLELPQAPHADTRTAPQVTSREGGLATLRCLFHGNPPPNITWRRGEHKIDGTVGRYRLLSDGALEIVSLFRNDSGVYICVADNELGVARQEIHLQVEDPEEGPASISGGPNAVVVGELGRSLNIRCLAYGYPEPVIYWYRGQNGPMVPFRSQQYETNGNVLEIRQLDDETLGEYMCAAYNGYGKPATWSVLVEATTPAPSTSPPDEPVYQVPVHTRLASSEQTVAPGAELNLPCEVDGYPTPDVTWTKDGALLARSDRIILTDFRLTIRNVLPADAGVYRCHASNPYSEHSSTAQIKVQGIVVPANCTDNPFFTDCHLIVHFCTRHAYYAKFCCKSCVAAGKLDPSAVDLSADEGWPQNE